MSAVTFVVVGYDKCFELRSIGKTFCRCKVHIGYGVACNICIFNTSIVVFLCREGRQWAP